MVVHVVHLKPVLTGKCTMQLTLCLSIAAVLPQVIVYRGEFPDEGSGDHL